MKRIFFLFLSALLMIHAGMPIYRERKGRKRGRANNNNNSNNDSEGDAAFEKLVEEMMGRVFLTSFILASAPNSEELERLTTEATETMDRISGVDSGRNRRPRTRRSLSEIIRSEFDNNARPSRRRRTMAEMIETPIPDNDNSDDNEEDDDDENDSDDYDDWPKDRNGDISDGYIPGHSGFFALR